MDLFNLLLKSPILLQHMFREPEIRPPGIVSNTFTLLVVLPFVMFLIVVSSSFQFLRIFNLKPTFEFRIRF